MCIRDRKYIDRHRNIITSTKEALFAEYPEFATGLKGGKIENRNKHRTTPIKIRKSAYYRNFAIHPTTLVVG